MLISKEQNWRSPAQKLEEEERHQDYKTSRKNPKVRKSKTYFNKPSKWLKRMIVKEQENVFLFEFELIVPAVLKCLF